MTLSAEKRLETTFYVEGKERYASTVRAQKAVQETVEDTLQAEEFRRIPGTQGDTLKAIQNLPGVARAPFGGGQLSVWGSAPQDTRTYVDGVSIPTLYHFGGLRSSSTARWCSRSRSRPAGMAPSTAEGWAASSRWRAVGHARTPSTASSRWTSSTAPSSSTARSATRSRCRSRPGAAGSTSSCPCSRRATSSSRRGTGTTRPTCTGARRRATTSTSSSSARTTPSTSWSETRTPPSRPPSTRTPTSTAGSRAGSTGSRTPPPSRPPCRSATTSRSSSRSPRGTRAGSSRRRSSSTTCEPWPACRSRMTSASMPASTTRGHAPPSTRSSSHRSPARRRPPLLRLGEWRARPRRLHALRQLRRSLRRRDALAPRPPPRRLAAAAGGRPRRGGLPRDTAGVHAHLRGARAAPLRAVQAQALGHAEARGGSLPRGAATLRHLACVWEPGGLSRELHPLRGRRRFRSHADAPHRDRGLLQGHAPSHRARRGGFKPAARERRGGARLRRRGPREAGAHAQLLRMDSHTLSRSERRDHPDDSWRLFEFDQTHILTLLGSYVLPAAGRLGCASATSPATPSPRSRARTTPPTPTATPPSTVGSTARASGASTSSTSASTRCGPTTAGSSPSISTSRTSTTGRTPRASSTTSITRSRSPRPVCRSCLCSACGESYEESDPASHRARLRLQ